LYVDDINLLDNEIANILLSVVSDGWVNVERKFVIFKVDSSNVLVVNSLLMSQLVQCRVKVVRTVI